MYPPLTAATLLTLALAAHAGGIYKCEIDGRTVYQQVACPAGETNSRVRVIETPASSLTGGLRASEMNTLQGIQEKRAARRARNNSDGLSAQDARYISSTFRRFQEESQGSNRREEEIAEAHLRQTLRRYGLELEQVQPELRGESILDRVQDEIAVREAGPEAQAQYREQRRQLLETQRAEERAQEAERRARQAEMAAQQAQQRAQQQAQQPIPTSDGRWLYPNDPAGNTYHGSDGGHYIRQGNMIVNPATGQTFTGH